MTEARKFNNLAEESEFWDQEDTGPYFDELEEVTEPLVDKRPPKKAISIRLDPDTILLAKRIARRMGLGYQTLFRLWIMEGLSRALREPSARPRQQVVVEMGMAQVEGRGMQIAMPGSLGPIDKESMLQDPATGTLFPIAFPIETKEAQQ